MMSAASSSTSVPLHQQTLLKGSSDAALYIGKHSHQQPIPGGPIPSGINIIPKKPMRPLTAYHIFFQIEREFIIQTTAGEDADKSIHDNKVYLNDVPQRYGNIKLLPDWYAGPGKRKKRKHRKQHGKIGFLELSRVIAARWAQLEQIDPETKGFVKRVANQELDEYYHEMKHYKELTKDLMPGAAKSVPRPAPKKKAEKRINKNPSLPVQHPPPVAPLPEMVSSSYQAVDFMTPSSIQLNNDINYFLSCIDSSTQHLLPPSFGVENQFERKRNMLQRQDSALPLSYFDPLLEASNYVDKPRKKQCTVKTTSCMSPAGVEVDICDDKILQIWRSYN